MTRSIRDDVIARIRRALAARPRNDVDLEPLPRDGCGRAPKRENLTNQFCERLALAGGRAQIVVSPPSAVEAVIERLARESARKVVLGGGELIGRLCLADVLRAAGFEVLASADPASDRLREAYLAADAGISSPSWLIAETGSLVLQAAGDEPRMVSLLPPLYIAVAETNQILPDLFDVFEGDHRLMPLSLPSCCTLITGPSKTGDIELRLVNGVHGPGAVEVVLIRSDANSSD